MLKHLPKFFFIFMAGLVACGSSWARSPIGAGAVVCTTVNMATLDLSCICDLCHSLWQHRILNLLGEARDQTCILRFLTCWAPAGMPILHILNIETFSQILSEFSLTLKISVHLKKFIELYIYMHVCYYKIILSFRTPNTSIRKHTYIPAYAYYKFSPWTVIALYVWFK